MGGVWGCGGGRKGGLSRSEELPALRLLSHSPMWVAVAVDSLERQGWEFIYRASRIGQPRLLPPKPIPLRDSLSSLDESR